MPHKRFSDTMKSRVFGPRRPFERDDLVVQDYEVETEPPGSGDEDLDSSDNDNADEGSEDSKPSWICSDGDYSQGSVESNDDAAVKAESNRIWQEEYENNKVKIKNYKQNLIPNMQPIVVTLNSSAKSNQFL